MTGKDLSIKVEGLTLRLPAKSKAPAAAPNAGSVGGRIVRTKSGVQMVEVLSDVSFEIERGAAFGLVGLNGSGKSTLLRVLAGIYEPTDGTVEVNGEVSTLFTNTLGLHPLATGAENIRLMAEIMGRPRGEIDALIKEVAEFSELGDFINLPVNTYSAGMRVRIGFGVVTSIAPDILLIDEVFGAGDHSFVDRARKRMARLLETSGALVMAGHSNEMLKQYCTHAIWLDRGKLAASGPIDDVLDQFRAHVREVTSGRDADEN